MVRHWYHAVSEISREILSIFIDHWILLVLTTEWCVKATAGRKEYVSQYVTTLVDELQGTPPVHWQLGTSWENVSKIVQEVRGFICYQTGKEASNPSLDCTFRKGLLHQQRTYSRRKLKNVLPERQLGKCNFLRHNAKWFNCVIWFSRCMYVYMHVCGAPAES